ncbi:50S ribosomal protein L17 [Candidatus Symbiobacter mobilis]|uniref:Large ribosomal subunit protein bL17 n=1 Tax=Candidatus Symbiobacter mobilis CR TaxID=946483 RepID=U5N4X0_9BURK|nr:50S ribosomal protein L17 [Candidatus Symbiobacter mobilis]AGX86320.1 ribosomal protein L17 [Candidatus Symbiobacter mobilis CR]
MRHAHGLRKLNRTSAHRKALLKNLMNALIEHHAIRTTLPKAKELRRVIEPMVTLAKKPTVHNRRTAFARLRSRASVVELFDKLGPFFLHRPGGYTRIYKLECRLGDAAPMALIEFVGREQMSQLQHQDGDSTEKNGIAVGTSTVDLVK